MTDQCVMGIDIGTTATKTIVVDGAGQVVAEASAEYPLSMPKPQWYEQNPEDWWRAVKSTVQEIVQKFPPIERIAGISFSGQMHGMTPLDAQGRVMRPCIIWADQRNSRQLEDIYNATGGVDGLLKFTNNRMLVGYTGGKILWFQKNEPELYRQTRTILLPKDYIRYRMTGEFATEVSDASGTGLLDVRNRRWSLELMDLLGIDPALMPTCYESTEISAKLSPIAAEELGLPTGIPVAGGGGDAVIAMTGGGVIDEGDFGVSLGTGGVLATALDHCYPNPDGILQISCNNLPGKWHVMGVTMGAGGALRWIKEAIGHLEKEVAALTGDDVYELLCREAERVDVGADGLLFLPHLFGSRCPNDDPNSRGAFIGLTFQHTKGHLLRSVLEGVVFSFLEIAEVIGRMGVSPQSIIATGGGARSPLWRQIMADMFGVNVYTVSGSAYGGAYGAALIAGVAVGLWPDFATAHRVIHPETETVSEDQARRTYKRLFPVFQSLYPSIKEASRALWPD